MSYGQKRWLGGVALVLAAILVWARDTSWLAFPADSLPLALGLPLAYTLGRPWLPLAAPGSMRPTQSAALALGSISFACGWVFSNLTLLTVGWTLLALFWATRSFTPQAYRARLAWLLLLSFPWLILEWPSLGWAFRLSSAAVTEAVFGLLQMPVMREGVHLNVMGVPIEIEASCAGWNLLQLALLAGVAFGTHEIRSSGRFAILLCALPAIAWLANFFRILLISGIALSFDAEVATGQIHGFTGLAVLAAVLAMTKVLCVFLNPQTPMVRRTVKTS